MSSAADAPDLGGRLLDHSIKLRSWEPSTNHKTICPKCSPTRQNKTDPCLSVRIDADGGGATWNCHHCPWKGSFSTRESRGNGHANGYTNGRVAPSAELASLRLPKPDFRASDYLRARGIADEVIKRNKVGCERRFLHKLNRQEDAVAFPYFVEGEHVNTKYRAIAEKDFIQERGARVVLYGLDNLKHQTEAIIVEGEIDCLSIETAGCPNVVSVPNGANENLIYLDKSASHVARVQGWVIAVDTDEKGKALAEALADRLGKEKCRLVVWPEGSKDANDALMKHGADAVRACIEAAQPYKMPESPAARRSEGHVGALPGTDADLSDLPESCEEALALGFASRFGVDLRYVHRWGQWYLWDGVRWVEDATQQSLALARGFLCEKVINIESLNTPAARSTAIKLGSAKTVMAVRALAQVDSLIAASVDQWDADPWLLNTPGGTVDLRTGDLRPSCRDDHCTKITAVALGNGCARWLAFLDRIFAGDRELIAFVQRMVGYCLTGLTGEHALFFCYGTGGNGKGVLINTVTNILGDYAKVAPMEVFTVARGDRHPTELAMLRGARLVTSQETEDGQKWPESKIKALTGGDAITARFMRQDFFTYTPQFKLVIAGNHKPTLRYVDEAIRRRLHLIPFTVTIPEDERDPDLTEKLIEEWPGILCWAIEGCREWQRIGLAPPAAVRDATTAYLEAEDALSLWMEECCEFGDDKWASSTALFTSWRTWCERSGEHAGGKKTFVQMLESRGYTRERKEDGRGFRGLGEALFAADEPYWVR